MIPLLIGSFGPDVNAALKEAFPGCSIETSVMDAVKFLSKSTDPITKVLVIPNGFKSSENFKAQVHSLQEVLHFVGSQPQLIIFAPSQNHYEVLQNKGLVRYSKYFPMFVENLELQHVITQLTSDDPVIMAPQVIPTDSGLVEAVTTSETVTETPQAVAVVERKATEEVLEAAMEPQVPPVAVLISHEPEPVISVKTDFPVTDNDFSAITTETDVISSSVSGGAAPSTRVVSFADIYGEEYLTDLGDTASVIAAGRDQGTSVTPQSLQEIEHADNAMAVTQEEPLPPARDYSTAYSYDLEQSVNEGPSTEYVQHLVDNHQAVVPEVSVNTNVSPERAAEIAEAIALLRKMEEDEAQGIVTSSDVIFSSSSVDSAEIPNVSPPPSPVISEVIATSSMDQELRQKSLAVESDLAVEEVDIFYLPDNRTPEEILLAEKRVEFGRTVSQELRVDEEFFARVDKFRPPFETKLSTENKLILVCNLFPDSGATFLTLNVASLIGQSGKSAAAVEYLANRPTMYNYLDGSSNSPENWRSISERVFTDTTVNGRDYWKTENTWWFPIDPEASQPTHTAEHVKNQLAAVKVADYTLLDISSNWKDPLLRDVYDKCDEIWVIMRPNVSKIMGSIYDFKKHMGAWSDKVKFVLNQVDEFTRSKDVLDGLEHTISLPRNYSPSSPSREYNVWKDSGVSTVISTFPAALVNKAEWNGEVFASSAEGKAMARNGLTGLINVVYPEAALVDQSRGGFFKLFGNKSRKRA